jgi:inactivated superfamily I helicase
MSAKFKALENLELNQTKGGDEMSYYSNLEKVAQDQCVQSTTDKLPCFADLVCTLLL